MDQLVQHVASNYVGPVKAQRLLFIAEHSPDLRDAALQLALAELRASSNTALYADVFERRFPTACAQLGLVPDGAWCESVDKQAQQQHDRLEHALNAAKTSLIKEDVRVRAGPRADQRCRALRSCARPRADPLRLARARPRLRAHSYTRAGLPQRAR
jgi:hypothetical protein